MLGPSKRFVIVLATGAAVGAALGLSPAPSKAGPPQQAKAALPLMNLHPSFKQANRGSHKIAVVFGSEPAKTDDGRIILPRNADGQIRLMILRQGFNNTPIVLLHRAVIQLYPMPDSGPRGKLVGFPLQQFELQATSLRPHGVDNFNVSEIGMFAVPAGDYILVATTAAPARPDINAGDRLVEKDPEGDWKQGSSIRFPISVR